MEIPGRITALRVYIGRERVDGIQSGRIIAYRATPSALTEVLSNRLMTFSAVTRAGPALSVPAITTLKIVACPGATRCHDAN